MSLYQLRRQYHQRVASEIIRTQVGKHGQYPNFADGSSLASVTIANHVVMNIGKELGEGALQGQTTGTRFEIITCDFLREAFSLLGHVRPGRWTYTTQHGDLTRFDQYEHLAYLATAVEGDKVLKAALGGDYLITPDIIVSRQPLTDEELNDKGEVVSLTEPAATRTPLRESNYEYARPILHGSISCKWTIRSDRAQNTRTEALNLIRNRKGNLPHISAVTAEPLPTRLAALALGTGDLDCVYHFALPELEAAIEKTGNEDQLDMLRSMTDGRRLRDISDLPLDLAI